MRFAVFALGLYVCLAASIIHRHTDICFGITAPWGLALGVLTSYLVAAGAEALVPLGAVWFMLGWAVGLGVPMAVPGPSYLIAQDWIGVTFMIGGVGSLAVASLRASRLSG